jgi:ribose transport system substrate-binding protein
MPMRNVPGHRRGAAYRLALATVAIGTGLGASIITFGASPGAGAASRTRTVSAASCPGGKGVVPASFYSDVKAAEATTTPWVGPKSSPKPAKGILVVDVSQTEANTGNDGAANGLAQAANLMGWHYKEINGGGSLSGMVQAIDQAIALKPQAIALESVPTTGTTPELEKAAKQGIALIGWHVATNPGKIKGTPLYWNVSTAPFAIAEISAEYAIVQSCGKAHAVELTTMNYPIDQRKNAGFDAAFRQSKTSSIRIDNYSFGTRATLTGPAVSAVAAKTHTVNWFLTINDSYYTYAIPSLKSAGIKPNQIHLDSAGDGSPAAFQRIRQGDYQTITVPEPLREQGWIMATGINRALHHLQPFNFVTKPHLTVKSDVNADGGSKNVYTPPNTYQKHYKELWGLK